MQTVNGRRLECSQIFSAPEEALQGGLEQLRQSLGW